MLMLQAQNTMDPVPISFSFGPVDSSGSATAKPPHIKYNNNSLHHNSQSFHSITQPTSRCPSPCQPSNRTRSYRRFTHSRYPSTPPSSRCVADSMDPIPTFLSKDSEMSNDVDYQVKLALTDLLNCTDVKADQEIRMWLQNRLMDTEHRLKARRKSRILNVHLE